MDSITLLATSNNVDPIIEFVVSKLKNKKINKKIYTDISIVLDELLTNIVNYAYKDKIGNISLFIDIDKEKLLICIEDNGIEFNPLKKEKPFLIGNVKERQIGGLGIFISLSLIDEIKYERKDNKNIITIKKLIN